MKISPGAFHKTPPDLKALIQANSNLFHIWEDITPLARNEWICWITSAKKPETVERRLQQTVDKLLQGMRRPCCFAGCPHRKNLTT